MLGRYAKLRSRWILRHSILNLIQNIVWAQRYNISSCKCLTEWFWNSISNPFRALWISVQVTVFGHTRTTIIQRRPYWENSLNGGGGSGEGGCPSLGVQPGFEAASLAWRRSPARDTKPGRTARFQVGIPNQWDFQLVGSLERGSAFGGKLGVQ